MTLLKRLRNIWNLGAYKPSDFMRKQEMVDAANKTLAPITEVLKKFNKAEIVKRGEPVGEFLDKVNQNNP